MILFTEGRPAQFQGRVSKIFTNTGKNGGSFTTYQISTRDKKQDESIEYSNWKCTLSKNCNVDLKEGDIITSTKFKITNASYKKADGSWVNDNCKIFLMNCEVGNGSSQATSDEAEEDCPY